MNPESRLRNHQSHLPSVRSLALALALMGCAIQARAQTQHCDLYPIALSADTVAGVTQGTVIYDIFNGTQPGNFGWLTWAGSPSEPVLTTSLTAPGDSGTYVNPNDPTDHEVSAGDWVQGKPGVSNSRGVRDALDALEDFDIIVPVWDQTTANGNGTLYHVSAFAKVRIIGYRLPSQNRISALFLGLVPCGQPPT